MREFNMREEIDEAVQAMREFNMREEIDEAVQAMCEPVEEICSDVEQLLSNYGYVNVCSSEQNGISARHFLKGYTHITLTVVESEDKDIIHDLIDEENSSNFNFDDFAKDAPELARELRFA